MKKILALLLTVALLGCEKDKKGSEPISLPKGIYLKHFIPLARNNPQLTYAGYEEYYYNSSGELYMKEFKSDGKVRQTWLYENSPGRISASYFANSKKPTSTRALYLNNNKLDRAEKAYIGTEKLPGSFVTEYFFYGSDNKISYSTHNGSRNDFEFDTRGNINKIKIYYPGDTSPSAVHTIEYDDKQNPFYHFDPSIYIDDFYLPYSNPTFNYLYYLCPNNLKSINSTFDNRAPLELKWTYLYNDYDYPIAKYFVPDPSQNGRNDTMYYQYHIVE